MSTNNEYVGPAPSPRQSYNRLIFGFTVLTTGLIIALSVSAGGGAMIMVLGFMITLIPYFWDNIPFGWGDVLGYVGEGIHGLWNIIFRSTRVVHHHHNHGIFRANSEIRDRESALKCLLDALLIVGRGIGTICKYFADNPEMIIYVLFYIPINIIRALIWILSIVKI